MEFREFYVTESAIVGKLGLMSAPRLNRYNYSSPTEAKYAKVYPEHEIAKEKDLQKVYKRVWLPPPVVHSPWD